MTAQGYLIRLMTKAVLGYVFRRKISRTLIDEINYQTWVCMLEDDNEHL